MQIRIFLASIVCSLTIANAQYKNNTSEYADKPADSYSNFKTEDGKQGSLIWGNAPLNDFGSRSVSFNYDGLRKLPQAPAPGVHPRIYFGPDELPDIRRRLKETKCGQAAWKNIISWIEMMKGRYDDKADYTQPDVWKGNFGGLHGRVPLFRLGVPRANGMAYNHNRLASDYYDGLANGTATSFPEYYWNMFSLEAFRCLIENDEKSAKKLALATMTALKIDQLKRDSLRIAKKITKPEEQPVGRYQLAFTYDLIFQWLSPEQKKAMHDELAENTWSHDNYGTFNAAEGSRSNWATFSYWLFEVLGIEGEKGFNDFKVKGMYRGWRNLMTYGWFQSGATFEGEAKNQLGMDGILLFAKRMDMYGFDNLAAHPYLQAYVQNFLPQSIIPTLDGFVRYDLLGGCHLKGGSPNINDLLGLKYMFPNDKRVDLIYHTTMRDDYANVPDQPGSYYFNALLFYAIFASDFDENPTPVADLKIPNTFFCGERALMMTRSNWATKDALMLNMHTRQANGGHPYSDRNAIMVAGAGRVWSPTLYNTFENIKHSVLTIDRMKQDEHTPGTMVAFKDEPLATFCAGSTKYTWDWNNKEQEKPRGKGYYTVADVRAGKVEMPKKGNWELEPNTPNSFSYLKLPYAYLDIPRSETPHWILPKGAVRPFLRQVNYPVKYAFRTAGIVRSEKPYALIVDDMEKDEQTHHFEWVLALEHDIQIVKTIKTNEHEMDIILTGDDPEQKDSWGKDTLAANYSSTPKKGQPMLLVRILNIDNSNSSILPNIEEWRSTEVKAKEFPARKLVVPFDAVKAKIKVMLYSYRNGDEIPKTSWNGGHDKLSVKWENGKKQSIQFKENMDGRTRIGVLNDKTIFEL